jgi:probable rRNA maturation factor
MITIKNTQRKIAINTKALQKDAQTILDALDYSDFDLSIQIVSLKKMHSYNRDYRNIDKATDILSFPFYPDLKAGKQITAKSPEEKNLGDIIICPEYVMDDLERWSQDFKTRMKVLLVHGICHLLGYDHIEDVDYKKMHAVEVKLLKKIL